MALPNSYLQKYTAIPAYFDAMLDAQPPERFSQKFLENLGFTSSNDRLFISVVKELGFINQDGKPQQRYFEFLDRSQSRKVIAEAIKEMFEDLYAVNKSAHTLSVEDVTNKLRTLYAGQKSDTIIDRVAKTFKFLCDYADFSGPQKAKTQEANSQPSRPAPPDPSHNERPIPSVTSAVALDSLQYHINIVLPESRDQAVYDAIFKSLRDHLGTRHG
ncbi:DUF5343 domain-containing protein [Geobacter benzoatilyticus]|uniref:DUF5343 domain-containing protein n=1 Tax=Geobacter benzoatilyticus TaxID=2815309 RepID=A0ABX7Q3B1_9BACT|nr:DUF5343 domain-containing protein [Geobacter benzoatilyticus]QSV45941.1 DUF5343 domain-containing protein [Geobacter benzoatilyticus]